MRTKAIIEALTKGGMALSQIEELMTLIELGELVSARTRRYKEGVPFTPLSKALGGRATSLFNKAEIDTLEALQLCTRVALKDVKEGVGEATMDGIEEYMADRGASFWDGYNFESRAIAIYGELGNVPIQPVLINALRTHEFVRLYPVLYEAGVYTLGDLLSRGRHGIMGVLGAGKGPTVLNWLRKQHMPLR